MRFHRDGAWENATFRRAIDALDDEVRRRLGYGHIAAYNDDSDVSHKDILEVFDNAIAATKVKETQ